MARGKKSSRKSTTKKRISRGIPKSRKSLNVLMGAILQQKQTRPRKRSPRSRAASNKTRMPTVVYPFGPFGYPYPYHPLYRSPDVHIHHISGHGGAARSIAPVGGPPPAPPPLPPVPAPLPNPVPGAGGARMHAGRIFRGAAAAAVAAAPPVPMFVGRGRAPAQAPAPAVPVPAAMPGGAGPPAPPMPAAMAASYLSGDGKAQQRRYRRRKPRK